MVYVVENDDVYCRMKRQWSATAEVLKRKKGADALILDLSLEVEGSSEGKRSISWASRTVG
jgi:hypothetical protein